MALFQVVIFRNGDMLKGTIRIDPVSIKSSFGTLKFKVKSIAQIQFKNPPYLNNDTIRLLNGDTCSGSIPMDNIPFTPAEAAEPVEIEKSLIHTIMFMGHE